ncbi:pyocin knob domain-containing protein [Veillonella montpellierensis]|uniref:pyocin knob domain-containing protein n=1 Tax=Veillonella montpellierensis TaxID=187328 RepID=UPI0023F640A8|nr:pyocin knob domain-containing protein [Veillonella montpellierensis]
MIEGFVASAKKCVTQVEAFNKDLSKDKADINNQIDMIHGVFEEIKKIRTAVEVINSTVTDNKLLTDANVTTSKQASEIALHCKNAIHDVLAQVTEVKRAIDNRTQSIIESIAKVSKGVDEATNQALLEKGYAEKARDIAGGDYVTHAEFTNVLKDKADKGEFASVEYVEGAVANVVDSAPETLNTLKELSKALNDDPNFATTISTQLGNKANATDVYNKSYIDSELHKRDIQLETMGKEKIKTTTGSEYAVGSTSYITRDINDFTTEGFYSISADSPTTHSPSYGNPARLLVLNQTIQSSMNSGYIGQLAFEGIYKGIWYRYKSMVDTKWGKWDKLVFKSDLDNLKNGIDSRVKMIDEMFQNKGLEHLVTQEIERIKSEIMKNIRIPTIPDMDLIFDGRKYNSKKGALNKKIYFTAPWDEYDILYVFYTLENSGTVSMSIVQSSIIKNLLNIAREMDLHMACIMDNVCGISTETLSTVWDVVYGHAGILYIYGYKQRGGASDT